MTTDGLPTLPTQLAVVQITEQSAPRTCGACGDPADVYVFLTARRAEAMADVESAGGDGDWPVNAFLCRACFRDAPRCESVEALLAE